MERASELAQLSDDQLYELSQAFHSERGILGSIAQVAPLAGPEGAAVGAGLQVIEVGAKKAKEIRHALYHSAGLTREENYRGWKWLGALLGMAYNDLATWWDVGMAQSFVGKVLGIRGNLPRVAYDPSSGGPQLRTTAQGSEVTTDPMVQAWLGLGSIASAISGTIGAVTSLPSTVQSDLGSAGQAAENAVIGLGETVVHDLTSWW